MLGILRSQQGRQDEALQLLLGAALKTNPVRRSAVELLQCAHHPKTAQEALPRVPRLRRQNRQDPLEYATGHGRAGLPIIYSVDGSNSRRYHWHARRPVRCRNQHHAAGSAPLQTGQAVYVFALPQQHEMQVPRIDISGLSMHLEQAGQGMPLLMIPVPLARAREIFRPRSVFCATWICRHRARSGGYGRSRPPERDYPLDFYSRDAPT